MAPESKILVDANGAPIDPTGGFEAEYGFKGRSDVRGSKEAQIVFPATLLQAANENYITSDAFYKDGSRRYIDVGDHPEYCTAEDIVFLNAAYRVLWGHNAMANQYAAGAKALEEQEKLAGRDVQIEAELYANTTDTYDNSWARHMNILAPRALMPEDYIPALVAHRASRIVWSGAGHVIKRGRDGFQYVLSEKAEFIELDYGSETTRQRPLVNLRDIPLADSELYRRIHDVSGEGVFSPRVMALQLASEAMILRACGLGVRFDDLKPFSGPLAMRTISHDPSLKAEVQVGRGSKYTGIQLQREIARRAITALERSDLMTDQDKIYKMIWQAFLDDLEQGRFTAEDGKTQKFDWVSKRRRITTALKSTTRKHSDYITAATMSREYHQTLPKKGTGMRLVQAGGFVDSPSSEVLENGPELPPTRGGLRGRTIDRLEKKNVNYAADWTHLEIYGEGTPPTIILRNPFATENSEVEAALESVAA